jgi:hypothetical protein
MIRATALITLATAASLLASCAALDETRLVASAKWDAVSAAPASHQVLLENARVRVLRVSIEPGGVEPIHEHGWPSVMYFEQPQPITYIAYELVGGKPTEVNRVEAPAMPAATTATSGPEGLHAIHNRGTEPFVAVRVEFKDGVAFEE